MRLWRRYIVCASAHINFLLFIFHLTFLLRDLKGNDTWLVPYNLFITGFKNERHYIAKEYSISVDGVKQEVYYPEDWKDLFPKSQYNYINYPYFILNVDAL